MKAWLNSRKAPQEGLLRGRMPLRFKRIHRLQRCVTHIILREVFASEVILRELSLEFVCQFIDKLFLDESVEEDTCHLFCYSHRQIIFRLYIFKQVN